jgi:hypothetical protein
VIAEHHRYVDDPALGKHARRSQLTILERHVRRTLFSIGSERIPRLTQGHQCVDERYLADLVPKDHFRKRMRGRFTAALIAIKAST